MKNSEQLSEVDPLHCALEYAKIGWKVIPLHTPIIDHTKADIIRRGLALGVDYALTVSCYQADDEGRACGVCDSCCLRKAGFEAAQVTDPTRYR